MCASCLSHLLADARLKDETPTCPGCRCEISRTLCSRNLAVEKAISELPAPCQFCARLLPRSLLPRHEKEMCQDRFVGRASPAASHFTATTSVAMGWLRCVWLCGTDHVRSSNVTSANVFAVCSLRSSSLFTKSDVTRLPHPRIDVPEFCHLLARSPTILRGQRLAGDGDRKWTTIHHGLFCCVCFCFCVCVYVCCVERR